MCWSACVAERAQQNMTNSISRPARPIIHVTISFTSFPEICVIVSFGTILMPKGQRHMHTSEPADRRLRRMVSTVVSKLKLFSCFLPRPVPIPISAMYFPGKTRRMHIQCQVSIWAGYSVVKVPCRKWNRAPSPSYPGAFQGYSQASKARQKKFFWKILWLLLHRQIKKPPARDKIPLTGGKTIGGIRLSVPRIFHRDSWSGSPRPCAHRRRNR